MINFKSKYRNESLFPSVRYERSDNKVSCDIQNAKTCPGSWCGSSKSYTCKISKTWFGKYSRSKPTVSFLCIDRYFQESFYFTLQPGLTATSSIFCKSKLTKTFFFVKSKLLFIVFPLPSVHDFFAIDFSSFICSLISKPVNLHWLSMHFNDFFPPLLCLILPLTEKIWEVQTWLESSALRYFPTPIHFPPCDIFCPKPFFSPKTFSREISWSEPTVGFWLIRRVFLIRQYVTEIHSLFRNCIPVTAIFLNHK